MTRFQLFGVQHVAALAVIAAVTGGLVWVVRRWPGAAPPVRFALAMLLVGTGGAVLVIQRREGTSWVELAPLHLCDMAILVAAWALVSGRRQAVELAYFWGAAGTVLAVITPDLAAAFPSHTFLFYFGLHGGVIAAAVLMPFGLRQVPRPGAVARAMLWTNAYAVGVGVVNLATGANFLYLCRKPSAPTPLDWFGPWPMYLVVGEVVAVGLFSLLYWPFRRRARGVG